MTTVRPETGTPGGLFIELDTTELERRFAGLPKLMSLALARAARRTRDWLSTQLRRELAAAAKLPQQALKTRFRKGKDASGEALAVLWIGLNPVMATRAGKAIQTAKGVRVGRHVFRRAFVARISPSHPDRICLRVGKPRLPILKVKIPLDPEMEKLLPKYEGPAAAMFAQRLEHEVDFLLTHGGGLE